ncbi:MAG: serine/threonine protein kinase [Pirellulaceae bacterium]|nr:serine/threonine protein kinase [Pirellulaceae bacterium]
MRDSDRDFRDLVNRLVSVCKTVAYAHSRGIAHRDLKPQNIMLGNYGETVIIDWGSANRVERAPELKLPGEKTLGVLDAQGSDSSNHITLGYASPEQLIGEIPAGPASDIYSLGAILYKLLTSVTPYTNLSYVSLEQLVDAVKSGQLPSPSDIRPGVPRQLAAICHKAMSFETNDRYTTALDMASDLEKYLADARVSVCRDGFGTSLVRVIRKNRTASLMLLALFGLSSVLLSLALARQGYMAVRAQQLADERLKTSATMAALIGGLEIDRRFSLLESEAQQPAWLAALREVDAQPTNKATWERPQVLLFKLAEKLKRKEIEVDNVFITNALGTQIARVPETDVNGKVASIGTNFAYRQYFHGQSQDIDVESEAYRVAPPPPCVGKVLTNAYVSVNLGQDGQLVKTAISVAITDIDAHGERRILGRLGISVCINDLGIFRMLEGVTVDAFVIESRQYEWGGRNARGLALGRRKESATTRVSVVPNSQGSFTSQLAEVTPGLSSSSAEQIFSQLPFNGEAVVLYGFHDAGLGIEKQDVAVAQIRVPSDDSLNVWSVLLVEQTQ